MRRIEITVFIACVLVLAGWMTFGPERYVHRARLAEMVQRF